MNPHASPLDGIWELVRAEMNGETAPELVAMHVQLELAAGEYRVRFAGQVADRGTFEVVGGIEVQRMVLHGIAGPNTGRTIPCIYQHVGERLRVCYGLNGIEPTDFTTAKDQQRYLATYRRCD